MVLFTIGLVLTFGIKTVTIKAVAEETIPAAVAISSQCLPYSSERLNH